MGENADQLIYISECIFLHLSCFLEIITIFYWQSVSKTIFRTYLLWTWRCMRLLLNYSKSLLFLCQFFVNLFSKQFKFAKDWASLCAIEIAWKSRVLSAWPIIWDFFPGTVSSCFTCYVWFVLTVLCVHFSIFAILFHFISAMPYHFPPHWFQNNASAERRGG